MFARDRAAYIAGLERFRAGGIGDWLETFATAAAQAAALAEHYLTRVRELEETWRSRLTAGAAPRADAAAWAILAMLPAHPVITAPVAVAATARAKSAVHSGLDQLARAGVLVEIGGGRRNRSWEAGGLLDLIADLDV